MICSDYSIICCTREMAKFIQVGWCIYTLLCSSYLFWLWAHKSLSTNTIHSTSVLKEFQGYSADKSSARRQCQVIYIEAHTS